MCLERYCKKMCEVHKSPVNCLLHLIAAIILIYSLWVHSVGWILIGVLVAVIGHIIQEAGRKGEKAEKKTLKKRIAKKAKKKK